jgi:hypothetical protein
MDVHHSWPAKCAVCYINCAAAAAAAAAAADKNPVLKEFATEVTKVINEAVAALEGQQ